MVTLRRFVLAATLLALAPLAHAVGLGHHDGVARLGEPLAIEIPVSGPVSDPALLRADVPRHSEHARLGATDPIVPRGLVARVVSSAPGRAAVRLETSAAVNEPVLRFLVRIRWPGGQSVREYQLLLDPPFHSARAGAARAAARPARETAVRVATSASVPSPPSSPRAAPRAGSRYGPVAFGETLGAIVRRAYLASGADLETVARAVVSGNPQAFVAGDPDRLMQGAWLDLPSPGSIRVEPRAAETATAAAPTAPVAALDPDARTYGPVRPGETLYAIARRVSAAPESAVGEVARRIHGANPHAFVDNDMSRLMVGAVLDVASVVTERATADLASPSPARSAARGRAPSSTATTSARVTPGSASPAAPGSRDIVSSDAVAQMRAVMERERARTRALEARLADAQAQLQALREQEAQLSRAIERKSEELRRRMRQLAPGGSAVMAREAPAPAARSASGAATPEAGIPAQPASPGADVRLGGMLAPLAPGAMPLTAAALALVALATLLALMLRRRAHRYLTPADSGHSVPLRDCTAGPAPERRTDASPAAAPAQHDAAEVAVIHPRPAASSASGNVARTDSARANDLAKQAAVSLAYEDYVGSKRYIEEAIRLEPHRDEHKMVLLTLYECLGDHRAANALVDDLVSRREQLSGTLRAHVEELSRRRRQ